MERNNLNDIIRVTWNLRRVSNVFSTWYTKTNGTFCSCCELAYDFDDSYKALLQCRAKGQNRGPRCIKCGKLLRCRSKPTPNSGFWSKVDEIEGEEYK